MMPDAKLARMLSDNTPLGHVLSADPGAGDVPVSDFRASSDAELDARPMNWGICCDNAKETLLPHCVTEVDVIRDAPIHVLHARNLVGRQVHGFRIPWLAQCKGRETHQCSDPLGQCQLIGVG